ncbi:hypothetical protein BO82DRAFT_354434 [Aspergillus uvarum CBS 121591]|uniref:Secreted protein n=1 Tax=Aspergillus uvarum CBS 121591 TaxID=1448315 RepID=A0A319D199_9EURO|nr:hypothetical protein BO82DRAFT_354434 [Aspergillus uvarum CBS 121591]PYH81698.1 hypothetical protein BO82DRAFT_354434 [Aspergillus uvarum CBS 121591]
MAGASCLLFSLSLSLLTDQSKVFQGFGRWAAMCHTLRALVQLYYLRSPSELNSYEGSCGRRGFVNSHEGELNSRTFTN